MPCFWIAFTAFSSAFSKGVCSFDSSLVDEFFFLNPKPLPGPLLLNFGAAILRSSKTIGSIGNCSNQSSLKPLLMPSIPSLKPLHH